MLSEALTDSEILDIYTMAVLKKPSAESVMQILDTASDPGGVEKIVRLALSAAPDHFTRRFVIEDLFSAALSTGHPALCALVLHLDTDVLQIFHDRMTDRTPAEIRACIAGELRRRKSRRLWIGGGIAVTVGAGIWLWWKSRRA